MDHNTFQGGCLAVRFDMKRMGRAARSRTGHCSISVGIRGCSVPDVCRYPSRAFAFEGNPAEYRSFRGHGCRRHCGVCVALWTFVSDSESGYVWLTWASR